MFIFTLSTWIWYREKPENLISIFWLASYLEMELIILRKSYVSHPKLI